MSLKFYISFQIMQCTLIMRLTHDTVDWIYLSCFGDSISEPETAGFGHRGQILMTNL